MNKKVIKDFSIALKDMEPYIKEPKKFLTQGKRFTNFDMLLREAWANWLICVVLEKITGSSFTFGEDDGDGTIINKTEGHILKTEHVCALDFPEGRKLPAGEARVLWAINHKVKQQHKYKGKILIVFFDGAGWFRRDKIREAIYKQHNFGIIFIVGLLSIDKNGSYSYSVTEYRNEFGEKSLTHKVTIDSSFQSWKVEQIRH